MIITRAFKTVLKRELLTYSSSPISFIFISIFLMLSGFFTFEFGNFYFRGQADLEPFFSYHPWLYLFLVPAMAMRVWAEEKKTGTVELLLTLPIMITDAVLGKFFALWIFLGVALSLTFPIWITVNYLGDPDNGAIFASYIGSWLLSGAFLSVGCCMSACTKNQVIAFILTVVICLMFILSGYSMVLNSFDVLLPAWMIDLIAQFSFMTHFESISKGVLDIRDIFFHILFISCWLYATVALVDLSKSG